MAPQSGFIKQTMAVTRRKTNDGESLYLRTGAFPPKNLQKLVKPAADSIVRKPR